jgi:hypothetical protein
MSLPSIDGLLIQWGDRLFYPGNRRVTDPPARLRDPKRHADTIRLRIQATLRRTPQVMVKVTGGGRGMKAIAAHWRYISKNGRLEIEDERGQKEQGMQALREFYDEWKYGGSLIEDVSHRREALNIMLSMPHGADPQIVLKAAREFAEIELADHKYLMVLHEHQANPHVHICVRAESKYGHRLNPRKADLQRWRQVFAERLREWGVEAEATRPAVRGTARSYEPIWRIKARADGRLRSVRRGPSRTATAAPGRSDAARAWGEIWQALAVSGDRADRELAGSIRQFLDPSSRSPTLAPMMRGEPSVRDRAGPER